MAGREVVGLVREQAQEFGNKQCRLLQLAPSSPRRDARPQHRFGFDLEGGCGKSGNWL